MACLEDLKLTHRLFIETYPFRMVDWTPGSRLVKPLSHSKLVLISSAGVYLPGQPPFDLAIRGGDFSFRELPSTIDVRRLKISQRSSAYDQTGAKRDANLVFPLDRFRELVERGEIGGLNHRHFGFMGSISAPGRLISNSAPQVAKFLQEDGVDAAFLVPAWPMCNQSVGLIGSIIEKAGIPTVGLSLLRMVTMKVRPPRALYVPFPFGYPLGKPNDAKLQYTIIRAALELLESPGELPMLRHFAPG